MTFKNKIIFIMMLTFSQTLYAFDMRDIVAYPVPFNPQKKTLTIGLPGDPTGALLSAHTVRVNIYDINGDLVINKLWSQGPHKWNGRNSSGRYVKPGLYILKVEIENDNGFYGKKIIRILVDY